MTDEKYITKKTTIFVICFFIALTMFVALISFLDSKNIQQTCSKEKVCQYVKSEIQTKSIGGTK